MGYRIEYGQTMTKTSTAYVHTLRRRKLTLILMPLCFVLVITLLWNRVGAVRDFIIPGNTAVTEAAVTDLVNDLRAGENFGDAIAAFCREIIENANIPG